jgi:hypothetical protein
VRLKNATLWTVAEAPLEQLWNAPGDRVHHHQTVHRSLSWRPRAYHEGMEDQLGALGLVLNCITLWNTVYLDAAIEQLRATGYPVLDADVAQLSRTCANTSTSTATALERLTSSGHIHIVDEQIVNGRARRSYELTSAGGAALKEQADRLASAARVVTERRVTRAAVRPA